MSNLTPSRKSPLEEWVYGYLKKLSKGGSKRSESKFIEKAINQIYDVIASPCCSGFPKISVTPHDNELTRTVRAALQHGTITRPKRKQSLLRILDNLNDVLYGDCCTGQTTISFTDGVLPSQVQVQFIDTITNEVISETSLFGSDIQTLSFPKKYVGSAPSILAKLVVSVEQSSNVELRDILNSLITVAPGLTIGTFSPYVLSGISESYTISFGG